MKLFKRLFVFLFIAVVLIGIIGYFYAKSTAPDYEGTQQVTGLTEAVNVTYDDLGIPHIVAKNSHDAYLALGYVHAQDRLFQMDLIRRLVSGRLSEFIGEKALPSDKYMLTLSLWKKAKDTYEKRFKNKNDVPTKLAQAYIEGINQFMQKGNLPIEYKILGMPVEPFTAKDMYATICYMSLGFTAALEVEPLMTKIAMQLGDGYTADLGIDSLTNALKYHESENEEISSIMQPFEDFMDAQSLPIWYGSNNWVISKEKSKSGKVLLANDTHIKHSQPAVWYEASISYPGFDFYGYYLAGVPFPIVGHNENHGWGLTIFPIDNMDLYRETLNPNNENETLYNGKYIPIKTDHYTIKVKGQSDVAFDVKTTHHGPIINKVKNTLDNYTDAPISMYWSLLDLNMTSIEAMYGMTYAKNIDEFRNAVALNDVIGLNVLYGDAADNIAWWASGAIPRRDSSINSKLIHDGSTSKSEHKGYYPFAENPFSINPEIGFLHTANSEPNRVNGVEYPGYYVPGLRNARIDKLLLSKDKFDMKDMAAIQNDNVSDRDPELAKLVIQQLDKADYKDDPTAQAAIKALNNWDGAYKTSSVAPTIFNSLLYFILKETMQDEMGSKDFERIVSNYSLRGKIDGLFHNNKSKWYDNINTKDIVETRKFIFKNGFNQAMALLKNNNGPDVGQWQWGKVHTVTYHHPIGSNNLMNTIFGFNVGPFPIEGGNEIINKQGNTYNAKGDATVNDGPALRLLVDFNDPKHAWSCIPTGQSGNVFSPHYSDQAKMYVEGLYHTQYMDVDDIVKGTSFILQPKK